MSGTTSSISTDALIDELWGDNPPSTAVNLVSIYVHRLRKEVLGDSGGKALVYRAPGYMLRLAAGRPGLPRLRVAGGRRPDRPGGRDPEQAARLLSEALGLWRGPLLADVPSSSLLAAHADRAAELLLSTTELRIEADLACGRAALVIPELRGLVAEHPLRERLRALLIRALDGGWSARRGA